MSLSPSQVTHIDLHMEITLVLIIWRTQRVNKTEVFSSLATLKAIEIVSCRSLHLFHRAPKRSHMATNETRPPWILIRGKSTLPRRQSKLFAPAHDVSPERSISVSCTCKQSREKTVEKTLEKRIDAALKYVIVVVVERRCVRARNLLTLATNSTDSFQAIAKIACEVKCRLCCRSMPMSRIECAKINRVWPFVNYVRLNETRENIVIER